MKQMQHEMDALTHHLGINVLDPMNPFNPLVGHACMHGIWAWQPNAMSCHAVTYIIACTQILMQCLTQHPCKHLVVYVAAMYPAVTCELDT